MSDYAKQDRGTSPESIHDGWDTLVAAVHAISKIGQPVLLTLTADNMKPIWIDFYTDRFYMEALLRDLPDFPLNPKVYSQPVNPKEPPYPWVKWKSMDSLLWAMGEKAFVTDRALWLILGERYTLTRWPNLTQIPYTVDDLRSISMLANGELTIDELALVARSSVEDSQKLVSILSLMGVLKSTGAPLIPVKLSEAPIPAHQMEQVVVSQAENERTEEKVRDFQPYEEDKSTVDFAEDSRIEAAEDIPFVEEELLPAVVEEPGEEEALDVPGNASSVPFAISEVKPLEEEEHHHIDSKNFDPVFPAFTPNNPETNPVSGPAFVVAPRIVKTEENKQNDKEEEHKGGGLFALLRRKLGI